jgi:hypothetical protein
MCHSLLTNINKKIRGRTNIISINNILPLYTKYIHQLNSRKYCIIQINNLVQPKKRQLRLTDENMNRHHHEYLLEVVV